ncbi:hypothetical protein AGMMS49574_05360 [Bacteroidia bacterium]|nr:hypothetical protein AGMMS49574_05360 [Bacteroidia bacterium]
MKTLYFKCKLLTDIVLNQRAATEGNQESLDFIPGNNFLGIVAGQLYGTLKPEESLLLFHSGKVRFGDAHPEKDNKRALRIPASFYKAKLDKDEYKGNLHVAHEVTNPDEQAYKDFQPKQCRTGFYIFENEQIKEEKVKKSFAIKSAYDRRYRRSEDEKMYGYESLQAGSSWLFEVAMDDDVAEQSGQIKKALTGTKRIGRSRTAQYGLAKIEDITGKYNPMNHFYPVDEGSNILVYADARLIFLDEYSLPTFQPTAKDLGFEGGEIIWSKSQIRTFQYAPWNLKRHTRDTDRCGIEKGSVFFVRYNELVSQSTTLNEWVGSYQNEGFGKVIYNPIFLQVEQGTNGKAKYNLVEPDKEVEQEKVSSNDPLFSYLLEQQGKKKSEQDILKKVNEFVAKNKDKYTKVNFASQWGTIRSIAMRYKTKDEIMCELFTKKTNNGKDDAYLTHGVAKDKWDERSRRKDFKTFIESFPDKEIQSALINLASEMAKISKK